MSFSSFGFPPSILSTLVDQKFLKPTPIQEKVIPAVLEHRDVLGIAKTGSGKTASYVLPILVNCGKLEEFKNRYVQVLVVVPTRELAVQVGEVFQLFGRQMEEPIKSLSVFGGASINPQMIGMNKVQILVATPGRLLELVHSKAVNLSDVSTLVLDEADKMLDLGFKDEVNEILGFLPINRQNLLFSATLSPDLEHINQLILKTPIVLKIEAKETDINLIHQIAYLIPEKSKGPFLRKLILEKKMNQVLIFASSAFRCDAIADKLKGNGIDAKAIHSKKSQGARQEALNRFKSGKLRVLVATDLLARGIDIEFLPFVINYELPRSLKDYVHRIGRTGRAESFGEAISLISSEEEHHFNVIQKKIKVKIELIDPEI